MREKQEDKGKRYGLKITVFVILAFALSFLCVAGALLDMKVGTSFVSVLFKVTIIAGILAYARYKKEFLLLWGDKFFSPYLYLAVAPCVIFLFSVIGNPDSLPSAVSLLFTVLNILTTAVWEELFFRYVGKSLFGKDKGFAVSDFVMLTIVFASVHLVNMLFYPPMGVLFQVAEAATAGIFWLALYCKTKNILVSIVSHFALNLIAGLVPLFVANPTSRFFVGLEDLFVVIAMLFWLLSGLFIITKNGILQKRYT